MKNDELKSLCKQIDLLSFKEKQQLLAYLNRGASDVKNRSVITQEELDMILTLVSGENQKAS